MYHRDTRTVWRLIYYAFINIPVSCVHWWRGLAAYKMPGSEGKNPCDNFEDRIELGAKHGAQLKGTVKYCLIWRGGGSDRSPVSCQKLLL